MNKNFQISLLSLQGFKLSNLIFILFFFIIVFDNLGWGQYIVNFEGTGETKTAYASGNVNLSGINWEMNESLIGTEVAEVISGIRSARLRGYATSSMTMLSNKSNGIGLISFFYRRYGTDTQVDWKVEYSTNNGTNWTQIGSSFTAPASNDVQTFSENVNIYGDIRIRIKRATESGTSNRRLNIDDITITDFTPILNISSSSLSGFTYVFGSGPSASQDYNISGSNLNPASGNITITGSSNYEVSPDNTNFSGSFNIGYSSGTLSSTTIYVRLKSGLPVGSYNYELISNSGGGAATVYVTCHGSVTPITNPDAQTLPYIQDFSGLPHTSSSYSPGWQGWKISSNPGSNFNTSSPVGDMALFANSTASTTSGNIHNYDGKIGFLNSSENDLTITLAINTTGKSNVQINYDIMTIRNPYDGSSNTRINEVTLQYRIGTSGTFTNLTGIEYQNNTMPQTSGTTPQNLQSKSVILPSVCDNKPVVQLRWVSREVSGAGSRPSFAVDNININESTNVPVINLSSPNQIVEADVSIAATNVILSNFQAAVTVANSTLNSIVFSSAGTYSASDITNFKLWYNGTSNTFGNAVQIGSAITTSLGTGTHTFSGFNQAINNGSTGYFWITCDISNSAIIDNQINVAANPILIFASANQSGTISAGGIQTIKSSITYTWEATGTGNWQDASNWSPDRNSTSVYDVLQLNSGSVVTITNVPTQTIRQLLLSNNTNVTLQANGSNTLIISGGAGTDFNITSGSKLNINGSNTLIISLSTGESGTIFGSMTFSGGSHRLLSTDISFESGSEFIAETGFDGSPFGTTNLNSIIFKSGSKYIYKSGANPFGANQPNSVVSFQTGSLYVHKSGNFPAFSGRTYADFELDVTSSITVTGTSAVVIDNLTITNGTMNFNMTGTPGHTIKGNIIVNSNASLNFGPSSAGTVNFSGSATQNIGAFTSNNFSDININNSNNIILTGNITAGGSLTMSSGNINLNGNTLELGTSPSSAGTLSWTSGYIMGSGIFKRWFGTNVPTSQINMGRFPFGVGSNDRSLWIWFSGSTITSGGSISVSHTDGAGSTTFSPTFSDGGLTIDKHSNMYWSVTQSGLNLGSVTATMKLLAGGIDGVQDFTKISLTKGTSVAGGTFTAGSGSNSNPEANRSGLGINDLGSITETSVNYYLGSNSDNPMPVSISSFNSVISGRNLKIYWITSMEENNSGFEVQRSVYRSPETEVWNKIGFVSGKGKSNEPLSYSYEDRNLESGKYKYRLKQIDHNGNYEYFELAGIVDVGIPSKFDLSQNYPNPFNPVTKINFDIPQSGLVSLKIYDILGREVSTLINEIKDAGYYTITFDASKLSSGVYFYRLTSGGFSSVKRLVVLK